LLTTCAILAGTVYSSTVANEGLASARLFTNPLAGMGIRGITSPFGSDLSDPGNAQIIDTIVDVFKTKTGINLQPEINTVQYFQAMFQNDFDKINSKGLPRVALYADWSNSDLGILGTIINFSLETVWPNPKEVTEADRVERAIIHVQAIIEKIGFAMSQAIDTWRRGAKEFLNDRPAMEILTANVSSLRKYSRAYNFVLQRLYRHRTIIMLKKVEQTTSDKFKKVADAINVLSGVKKSLEKLEKKQSKHEAESSAVTEALKAESEAQGEAVAELQEDLANAKRTIAALRVDLELVKTQSSQLSSYIVGINNQLLALQNTEPEQDEGEGEYDVQARRLPLAQQRGGRQNSRAQEN
jgi:hypothetical protein